jgi:putative SOS response-associated peptidase YedK
MCGRYTLDKDKQELEGYFDAVMENFEQFGPHYNVAPTHNMPVVGQNREGERTIRPFRWGLLPFWAKEEKVSYSMFNAKAESIDSKKSYKPSLIHIRRCRRLLMR